MTENKMIYIASPYTLGCKEANVERQIDVAGKLMDHGFVPVVPLLYHYVDIDHPNSYEHWAEVGMALLRKCDAVLRLPGKSKGADAEVIEAQRLGMPVYYSMFELLLEE